MPLLPSFDGLFQLGRGDLREAVPAFVAAARHVRAYNVDAYPEMILECVRALVLAGERDRAVAYRDLDGAAHTGPSAAHASNIDALLERDPVNAVETLRRAVDAFERLGMRLFAARAMVDLGRAMRRAGDDAREVLEGARERLLACDAKLFLGEVDAALFETG
jgi:hypothetical protein